jgi:essential nuclear protein 1
MFVSMMKPPQARVFLEGVLLDAIREDIRMTKEGSRKAKNHRKLNVHYYESLKRAVYKPAAFFKGIVFPLLQVSRRASLVLSELVLRLGGARQDARCKKPRLLPRW